MICALGKFLRTSATASHDAARVTVRGVDADDVAAGLQQRVDALVAIGADADRGADAQPAAVVLRRVRVLLRLLDVLDGDQALEQAVAVDHQQLLDAVLVQQLLGRLRASSPRRS